MIYDASTNQYCYPQSLHIRSNNQRPGGRESQHASTCCQYFDGIYLRLRPP